LGPPTTVISNKHWGAVVGKPTKEEVADFIEN